MDAQRTLFELLDGAIKFWDALLKLGEFCVALLELGMGGEVTDSCVPPCVIGALLTKKIKARKLGCFKYLYVCRSQST